MNDLRIYPDGRMDNKAAAAYLGFKPGTLNNWRLTGYGPKFVKRGGRIWYFKDDLDAWFLQAGYCHTTAQARLNHA